RVRGGPDLEDDGVEAEIARCVEDADQLLLRLLRRQTGLRWPVDVVHRGDPDAAELAHDLRRLDRMRGRYVGGKWRLGFIDDDRRRLRRGWHYFHGGAWCARCEQRHAGDYR